MSKGLGLTLTIVCINSRRHNVRRLNKPFGCFKNLRANRFSSFVMKQTAILLYDRRLTSQFPRAKTLGGGVLKE